MEICLDIVVVVVGERDQRLRTRAVEGGVLSE